MILLPIQVFNKVDENPRYEWIKSNLRETDKILNIGSHDGEIFKNTPFYKNMTHLDLNTFNIPNFVQGDAHNLPFKDKSFDVAILTEILEHVDDPVQCLKEARRVSNRVVITVPNEYEWNELYLPFLQDTKRNEDCIKQYKQNYSLFEKFPNREDLSYLWHHRYYDVQLLEYHLNLAGLNPYVCYKCNYGGWSFFFVSVNSGGQ